MLDRNGNVVTEEQDKQKEAAHVKRALIQCGYPEWSFKKVEDQNRNREQRKTEKKEKSTERSRGMITISYVKEVSEPMEWILRKHNIATAIRPHVTLRKLLVHPKDKVDDHSKTDCVYKIPCKSCAKVYIVETGRKFGTRLSEHKKEAVTSQRRGSQEGKEKKQSKWRTSLQ